MYKEIPAIDVTNLQGYYKIITYWKLNHAVINDLNLYNTILDRVKLDDIIFDNANFVETEIINSNLKNLYFYKSILANLGIVSNNKINRILYEDCRLTTVSVPDAYTIYKKSKITNLDFYGKTFASDTIKPRNLSIEDCTVVDSLFRDADIRGIDLSSNTFDNCIFNNAIYDEYTVLPKSIDKKILIFKPFNKTLLDNSITQD